MSSDNLPTPRRTAFIVTTWAEHRPDAPPLWRGSIETTGGSRLHFTSLAELNNLLRDMSGWSEPASAPEAEQEQT